MIADYCFGVGRISSTGTSLLLWVVVFRTAFSYSSTVRPSSKDRRGWEKGFVVCVTGCALKLLRAKFSADFLRQFGSEYSHTGPLGKRGGFRRATEIVVSA